MRNRTTLTESEFWRKLTELAKEKPFRILKNGLIRQKETNCCPMSAMAHWYAPGCIPKGETSLYVLPAYELGLSPGFGARVAAAADRCGDPLRPRLLAAVGLEKP